METPICDFVKNYIEKDAVRLHMPGHKGKTLLGGEQLDITEISGADVLYNEDGIIKMSQENAARLFGTGKTLYSAEGSSLCIRAMLYLVLLYAKKEGKNPLIAAARNVHKAFVSGAALLDIDVLWLFSKDKSLISCEIDFESLERMLKEKNPAGFYLTSPDYLGNVADIEKISRLCKKYNCLLMVDNAHGAYLKFLENSYHPMDLGADICCDSAHKTLPVLTGGAYLHISKNAPKFFWENAENAMSLFASTSPSYLIMQSLDMVNSYIENELDIKSVRKKVDNIKTKLEEKGYTLIGDEPLKITVSAKEYGYSGEELSKILESENIIPEFSDPDFLVLMFTDKISDEDFEKTEKVLLNIEKRDISYADVPKMAVPKVKMSMRDALMSPFETVKTDDAVGRCLAGLSVTCPPAVPFVVCGEEIDENAKSLFKYYGIDEVKVIKLDR